MTSAGQDRRVRYTKRVLRENMVELLRDRPINKITVRELCERADVSRGTFYSHYTDVYDLMNRIEEDLTDEIIGAIARHDGQLEKTYGVVMEILDALQKNRELCSVLIAGGQGYTTFMQRVMQRAQEQFDVIWYRSHTENARKNDYYNTFVISGGAGVLEKWILEGMKKPPEEVAATIERMVHYGLAGCPKAGSGG